MGALLVEGFDDGVVLEEIVQSLVYDVTVVQVFTVALFTLHELVGLFNLKYILLILLIHLLKSISNLIYFIY